MGMDLRTDIRHVATAAEEAGFDSLWVYERLVYPTKPRQDMYDFPGMPWQPAYRGTADPLTVLAVAAAYTERVRLGSSVLVAGLHKPVQLAKAFATVDQIAGGERVIAGLGSGWMLDEFEATGTERRRRSSDLEETIGVLRAVWGEDPVSYAGPHVEIDAAIVGPKPRSSIALMLGGGASETAARRIARHSDGWLATNQSGADTMEISRRLDGLAADEGRGEIHLEVINRANITMADDPLGEDRSPFRGSFDQVADDIVENAVAGVDELIVELQLQERFDGTAELLRTALELRAAVLQSVAGVS